MYLVKTPSLVQRLYPCWLWRMPGPQRIIYLTFDDGPTPHLTDEVLCWLSKYNARATFFLVGDNVSRYPHLKQRIAAGGHSLGNHTYHHLNGWLTPTQVYLNDIALCNKLVSGTLFRPPYGLLTRQQSRLAARNYRIIMWDVLSGDFDTSISREKCLHNVLQHVSAGSIVVFHDSMKAADRMLYVLPRVLDHYATLNYRFEAIPADVKATDNFAC
ncbi:MAG: polysaccharide deacetylase family protein [Chitinophagales bacterium]|nr:polysaccharide deacetylase family protein [Chitinophagales bacterium]MDW8426998.1 polysaccharide deacetylase family protein [Chitinophagales bacterium]